MAEAFQNGEPMSGMFIWVETSISLHLYIDSFTLHRYFTLRYFFTFSFETINFFRHSRKLDLLPRIP